jgi:restriction system protein
MQPAQYYAILQHHIIAADTLRLSLTGGHVAMRVTTPNAQGLVLTPEEFRARAGAIVQPEPWLVQYVIDHPDEMQGLSPWEFQVLFTGLLERMHYRAWLGRKGADGGVDVFAERGGEFGPERILVQCKHPRPGKKVGVEIVRLLHYTVIEEHATRGLVATDSSFTRNALQHITAYRFQMAGADGNRIRKWLEAFRTGAPWAEGRP